MTDFWNITPWLTALEAPQRIALVLWCMDRAFSLFDAVEMSGEEGQRLSDIRSKGLNLWQGPGPEWSAEKLKSLRRECEAYDADSLNWRITDDAIINRIFGNSKWLSEDNIVNAITNTVAITWSLTSIIPDAKSDDVVQALEAYYDIFYQPTWDRLTAGKTEIRPGEVEAIEANLDITEPLKAAVDNLKRHALHLREMGIVSFGDPRLRG